MLTIRKILDRIPDKAGFNFVCGLGNYRYDKNTGKYWHKTIGEGTIANLPCF